MDKVFKGKDRTGANTYAHNVMRRCKILRPSAYVYRWLVALALLIALIGLGVGWDSIRGIRLCYGSAAIIFGLLAVIFAGIAYDMRERAEARSVALKDSLERETIGVRFRAEGLIFAALRQMPTLREEAEEHLALARTLLVQDAASRAYVSSQLRALQSVSLPRIKRLEEYGHTSAILATIFGVPALLLALFQQPC